MTEILAGYTYLYEKRDGPRMLLLLHGTGGNERDIIPLGEELDLHAHLASVRGNVSENGMNRYFKRISEGVFDRADLAKRSRELGAFIEAAAEKHAFELSQTIGVGFSNGANVLLHLICTQPRLLKAAILLRPMSAALPDTLSPLGGLPIFIGSGEFDSMVPKGDAARLDSALRSVGASSTPRTTQSEHRLTPQDIVLAREWLATLP